jgi:nitroreductase
MFMLRMFQFCDLYRICKEWNQGHMAASVTEPNQDTAPKHARTSQPIHDLLARRFSPRAFSRRSVPQPVVTSLLEAARWSASSRNAQPWAFIVATRDDPAAHDRMLHVIKPGNLLWAQYAPVLMLTAAHDVANRPIALYDLGLAVQSLTVQALHHDLYVRQMGGIYPDVAHEQYHVPDDWSIITALAIGYLGEADDLPLELRDRESRPRERKPLAELVFGDTWGQASSLASE